MKLSIPPPWLKDEWITDNEYLQDLLESEKFAQYYEEYSNLCTQPEKMDRYLPVFLGEDKSTESLIEAVYEIIEANYDYVTKFEIMMVLDEFCCEINNETTDELEESLDDMRGEMLLNIVAALNEHYDPG